MISAPLFHSWGFSHFVLGMPLGATTASGVRANERSRSSDVASTASTAQKVLSAAPAMCEPSETSPIATWRR